MSELKLFLLIWVNGYIGGVAGPLPYDEAECLRRAADFQARADAVGPNTEGYAELEFRCEWHAERPEMNLPEGHNDE